jgi:hypothetical protein
MVSSTFLLATVAFSAVSSLAAPRIGYAKHLYTLSSHFLFHSITDTRFRNVNVPQQPDNAALGKIELVSRGRSLSGAHVAHHMAKTLTHPRVVAEAIRTGGELLANRRRELWSVS